MEESAGNLTSRTRKRGWMLRRRRELKQFKPLNEGSLQSKLAALEAREELLRREELKAFSSLV